MSIATAITNLQGRVESAYDKIEEKGGALPQVLNTANLPDAIDSIPQSGGSAKKWGMTLDEIAYVNESGTLNIFGGLSGSTVNFTGIGKVYPGAFYDAFMNNAAIQSASFPDLSVVNNSNSFHTTFYGCSNLVSASFPKVNSVTGDSAFYQAFMNCTSLGEISFPELSVLGTGTFASIFNSAFKGCTSLSSISFPKLKETNAAIATTQARHFQNAFQGCTSLSSISFPELTNIFGSNLFANAFDGCTALTSISFPKLVEAGGNAIFSEMDKNTQVTTLSFPELSTMYQTGSGTVFATFRNNTTLTALYFPKLIGMSTSNTKTAVNATHLFDGCTNLVEIHFGEENQTIIEGSSGYATKWAAPNANCQIYFDL